MCNEKRLPIITSIFDINIDAMLNAYLFFKQFCITYHGEFERLPLVMISNPQLPFFESILFQHIVGYGVYI